ncbi:hypothetical protein KTH_07120 [Thermosporothrix hazakensis]|nr:hypothetical protein KTC_04790 [Thermosporothrix sp. COM3]GCE45843.1 hypothetical protein KTH_07120 [Thermosporothrix hazakensis]
MEKALAAEQPPVLPARLSLQTLSHVSDQAWQERFFAALPSYAQMALEAPRLTHYRVLIEGKSVASARSSITPHSSLCVDEVYTDPAFRRRGLASILIQQLLYDASLSGIHTSVLLASEMGKPLYLKLGYRALATALIFEKKE